MNIRLNMLRSGSLMSCLDSLLGYSTGEFQAMQLIVLEVFGAVDKQIYLQYVGPIFENFVLNDIGFVNLT